MDKYLLVIMESLDNLAGIVAAGLVDKKHLADRVEKIRKRLQESVEVLKKQAEVSGEIFNMQTVKSGHLKEVGYDPTSETLRIRFVDSGAYRYKAVPKAVYDGFFEVEKKGESLDTYFRQKVRGIFNFEKEA